MMKANMARTNTKPAVAHDRSERPQLSARPCSTRRALLVGSSLVLLSVLLFGLFTLVTNLFWNGLGSGEPAPDFVARDMQGNPVRLGDYRGRPVMLTFWSPDCFACREELPSLQAIADNPGSDLALLTVVFHADGEEVARFVRENHLTFPVIVDEAGRIPELYQVHGVPFTYFIRPDGAVDRTVIGAGGPGELYNALTGWLSTCKIDAPCTVTK